MKPSLWYRASPTIAVGLAVVLVILAGVLVYGHGSLRLPAVSKPGNPVIIYIDGINRTISYRGGWTGYEGPAVNDSCPYCPVGAQAGGALRLPLATWDPPQNVSIWVFTNVTGPFPVQYPFCSGAGCTFPWVKTWTFETFVPAHTLSSMTLYATFLLPTGSAGFPNIVQLNATFCPVPVCQPPSS